MGNGERWTWDDRGRLVVEGRGGDVVVANPDGTLFSTVDGQLRTMDLEGRRANLLKAAPDMLEALQDIVEQAENTKFVLPPDLADSIRIFGKKAIAKAEGRS